jgi:arylsulfatase A-like enzyme
MKKWLFLGSLIMSLISTVIAAESRPNVILIISDDQGYGDMSCQGNPHVRTPHLDRWQRESVRWSDFHVAPMCTPTRGQLLTGCDALRHGATNVSSGRSLLRRELTTLPELLKKVGYTTGIFGKWHLGDNYPYRPMDRGFDEAVWFPSSHLGSVPDTWKNDYFDDTYLHGKVKKNLPGYTTDALFREAMSWMETQHQAGKPFFTYLPTAAPHSPYYVPQKYRDAVRQRLEKSTSPEIKALDEKERHQLATFLAMIENLDDNIGQLTQFLEEKKLSENTLVIFMTDNGSTWGHRYFPAGMQGSKVTLWEGGHRVPLFLRGLNSRLGPPRELKTLIHAQDVMPTVLDLCGATTRSKLDGRSLLPLMKDEKAPWPDRMLVINYSRMPTKNPDEATPQIHGAAVLWQRWRWLNNQALYDLEKDPLQQKDVAAEHPEIAAKMRAHLEKWWDDVKPRLHEPERVIIGHEQENPSALTACEWWHVFVDQQAQVRRGERKNGTWHLEVATEGEYEFTLSRWPLEAQLTLSSRLPAEKVTDGTLPPGEAIPIAHAELEIQGQKHSAAAPEDAKQVSFRLPLRTGPVDLRTTFLDAEKKPLCGAYYVRVERLNK